MKLKKKFKYQFVILSMFFMYVLYTLFSNFLFQVSKIKEYKEEIIVLNKTIQNTKSEIEEMKNYKEKEEYDLEKIARERLNMVKPNEIIYKDMKER